MNRFRFVGPFLCLGIALLLGFPFVASSEITEWTGNAGWAPTAWNEPVNWTRGVPTWGDEARIPCKDAPYGYAAIGQTNALCAVLTLGHYGKDWGTVALTGAPSFFFSCLETIGDAGRGVFLHSNGTHHVAGACLLAAYRYDNDDTGEHSTSSGRYAIADGLLAVRADLPWPIPGLSFPDLPMPAGNPLFESHCGGLFVGFCGQGTFEQTGGRVDADWLELGNDEAPGAYLLDSADPDGDELNVGHLRIAKATVHTNRFSHLRGSVTVARRPIPPDPWDDMPDPEFQADLEVYGRYDLSNGTLQVVSNAVVELEGTFRQTGGNVSILGSLTLDGTVTNQYELRAGTLQADELNLCRLHPRGTFDQWGGTNTVRILRVGGPRAVAAALPGFYTGPLALGCYLLHGGVLRVTGAECCYVGYDGQAFFMHTGDEDCRVRVDHKLYIGYHNGSDGLYSLGRGLVEVGDAIRVGADGGLGRLEWTVGKAAGGRIDTPLLELGGKGTLALGYSANVADLVMGTTSLFERATAVTGLGEALLEVGRGATVSQTGGYVCAVGALRVGGVQGGGTYLQQDGGTNQAGYVEIGTNGLYAFTGGASEARLDVTGGGLSLAGALDFNNRPVTVSVRSNSLVTIASTNAVRNATNATLQIAANTLSVFPPGFAPGMVFKSYSNAGRMHTAGNELKIGGGTNYTFAGCLEDPVRFQSGGGLSATTHRYVNLADFRELTGGGRVDAGLGTVTVQAGSAMMGHTGSVLQARLGRVSAPVGTNAALTQYAGSVTFREALYLGDAAGEKGAWTIDGPTTNTTLDAGYLVVGNGSVGGAWSNRSVFDHGCAQVRVVNDLRIAQVPGSCGQYICRKVTSNLIGGFAVKCAAVGGGGTGLFTHQHGRVVIGGDLVLGRDAGSWGTYVVEDGVTSGEPSCLETDGLIVGERGGATLRILDPDLPIVVRDRLRFGPLASAAASDIVAGATVCLRGASVEQKSTNAAALEGLNNLGLAFEGGDACTARMEAASLDCSTNDAGWTGNMAFRSVAAGGTNSVGRLALVDAELNQPDRSGREAVYADFLVIHAGSSLDLNGLACYSRRPAILSGTVRLHDGLLGCPSVLTNSGTVSGPGTLLGAFENRGTLEGGGPRGAVAVQGDFVQTGDGTLRLTLGGTGTHRYDRLSVSGHVALDGTLDVILHSAYSPRGGDSFDLLDWGSRSGAFDVVSLPSLPGGLMWDASRLDQSGVLRILSPGMVFLVR